MPVVHRLEEWNASSTGKMVLTERICRDGTATASTPPRTKKAMAMLLDSFMMTEKLITENGILD
jgi:hypothetical protein